MGPNRSGASLLCPSHLDLNHGPYDVDGVEYIDLVSLALFAGRESSMPLAFESCALCFV